MSYRAVDVMGFAGGFTLGVVQAGLNLVGKRELKGGFGVPNCEANRHLLGHEWRTEVGDDSKWSVPGSVDVVFGNPPCSGFSVMSAKEFRGANSKINHCMWAFANYVVRARPAIAVFESVQQAFTRSDGLALMRALRARVEEGTGESWTLYHIRHNAYSLGGAAQRRRYFWLVSRVPFGVEPVDLDHLPVLEDVIGDLATLGRSWYPQAYRLPVSRWVTRERVLSNTAAVDGQFWVDNPLTRRVRDLMTAVSWREGESISTVASRHWDEYGRLPESFAATEEKIVKNEFHMGFTTPVRWHARRPARVVTGGSLVMSLHPYLDRPLTHREAARILGFPDDWLILPLRDVSGLQMTWGKGISVQCGRWIGEWVRRSLDGQPGSLVGSVIGEREFSIDLTNDWQRVGSDHRCDTMVK